ncbi:MAG: EAL domain-containing protein [Alphaproteobacteria bacterium]|jgi:EAL domain-containing protein (putative c-di-GMP-specific phosphodiesterase class I)|nr:EAL domain-containing protein [Alphaproteobacteria bacterium]MBT7941964.1 EAL domain-containing protein [Alphaproteobacteria bacterium]
MNETPATSQTSRLRSDRDRFVAMSFCWADILIELDENEKVVFAVGPTAPLVGKSSDKLIGASLDSFVDPEDLSLIQGLLAIPRKSGRIEDATVRLIGGPDGSKPQLFVGYQLEDLGGHYFLAFRGSPSAGKNRRKETARDSETGLQNPTDFAESLKDAVVNGEIGEDEQLTLISLPGYEGMRERMDAESEQKLLDTLGTYLKANSSGGDMAARIGDGRYGLVHDKSVDVDAVEEQITQFSKEADPTGEGLEVQAASLDVDQGDVDPEDIASGLAYSLRMFQSEAEGKIDLGQLEANFSNLVSETADRVRDFRKLVASGDFDVAFHPILNAVTGENHHYEALVRFKKDGSGVSPYETITFAEEAGLIPEFDLAMATKVVGLLANIPDRFQAAVNISGFSVSNEAYVAGLKELLSKNQWASDRVLFEITESARMADLEAANEFIQILRKDGYEVCLDDFGAGAASFQYLATLDVDVVKFDGSVIKDAQRVPKGKAFLKALTRFCRELGVETIGEMVDSPEGLEFVRECGVQFVQGFLFGEPNTNILSFSKMDRKVEKLFGKKPARRAFG